MVILDRSHRATRWAGIETNYDPPTSPLPTQLQPVEEINYRDTLKSESHYRELLVYAWMRVPDFPEEDYPGMTAAEALDSVFADLKWGLKRVRRCRNDPSVMAQALLRIEEAERAIVHPDDGKASMMLQSLAIWLWP